MASSLLQDSMPSPPEDTPSSTSRFRPYSSPKHTVTKGRYITSNDPRGYVPVYEYPLNGQWLMVDSDNGYVLWTGIWKALGNSKADIVKMLESQPELAPQLRRVRGGYLKIQGTWMPYEIALRLARRVAWPIREDLVPLFGPTFPSTCLSPDQPGYGQLVNNPGRRKSRRTTSAPVPQQQNPHAQASASNLEHPPYHPAVPPYQHQQYQQPEPYQHHSPAESVGFSTGPGHSGSNPNEHGLALLSSAAVGGVQSHGYGARSFTSVGQSHLPPDQAMSFYSPQQPRQQHHVVDSSHPGEHLSSAHAHSPHLPSPTQAQSPYAYSPAPGTIAQTPLPMPIPSTHEYPHFPLRERGVARQQRYSPYTVAGHGSRASPPSFSNSSDLFASQQRSPGASAGAAMTPANCKQDGPILLPPLSSLGPPPSLSLQTTPTSGSAGGSSNYSLPPISSLDSPVSGGSVAHTDSSAVLRRLKLDDEQLHKSGVHSDVGFRMPTREQMQRRRSLSAPPLNGIRASFMDHLPPSALAWPGDDDRRQLYASNWRPNPHPQESHPNPGPPPLLHQQNSAGFAPERPQQSQRRPMSQHGQLQGPGVHVFHQPVYPSYREQYSLPPNAGSGAPAALWSPEGSQHGFTFPNDVSETSRSDVQGIRRLSPGPEWPHPTNSDIHRHQESEIGMNDPRLSACRDSPLGVDPALKPDGPDHATTRIPSRPW